MFTAAEIQKIDETEEITLVVNRPERAPLRVIVWIVVVDGVAYVRSVKGVEGGWYKHVAANPHGAIALAAGDREVVFEPVSDADLVAPIDAAYERKYGRTPDVDAIQTPAAVATTFRVAGV